MPYDQSWMATGWLGAVEAGAISALLGALMYALFARWLRERRGHGEAVGWAYLVALALGAGGDLWDLFYFNYARLQSVTLLRIKLAGVHDPAGLGMRAFGELAGTALGVYLAWLVVHRRER